MTEMETAMLQLVDMMREQQVKLDAMHWLVMELVKRELKGSYPRPPQKKPLEIKVNACRMKAAGASAPTLKPRPNQDAVVGGQANGC